MSSSDLTDWFVHQVLVRTYLGTTGTNEPLYADVVAVDGKLRRKRTLVRGASGDQVPSNSTYTADIVYRDTFTPGSLVIFDTTGEPFGADTFGSDDFGGAADDGVSTTVITVAVSDGGGFIDGLDCVRAFLA